jgi:signal peptidase II
VLSYRQIKEPSWSLNLALGLQMGGALGNLVDRIRSGYVVDFFDLTVWPVFNIADSAICVGVGLLAWNMLFPRQNVEQPERA